MHWYVRSKNKVIGPFPAGQIQQSILLGRIKLTVEVSADRETWKPLRQCRELIPEVMLADPSDEHARERLAAARRWADERRLERRNDTDPERLGPGRREPESITTLGSRSQREALVRELRPGKERYALGLMVVILLLVAGAYAGFTWVPQQPAAAQCEQPAGPAVNWRSCNKAGIQLLRMDLHDAILNSTALQGANLFASNLASADLAYADLSRSNLSFTDLRQANLKGVNLRSADLSKANLDKADLSYANLENAILKDASVSDTDFSHAIWITGETCLPQSLGACRLQ